MMQEPITLLPEIEASFPEEVAEMQRWIMNEIK
jgi:hypothetical protein